MTWVELFAVLVVCHLVGDFVLQTHWQATRKRGGLGADRESLRALTSHVAAYTLTFVPALFWVGDERGAVAAIALGAVIAASHLIQDDGRLLDRYMRSVKKLDPREDQLVAVFADQALHAVTLLVAALVVAT